jgi:hypothetical protein
MSSITDIPISRLDQDLLKIKKYAAALTNFILTSDTPITVGLQGEWGTGKTSLMSILNEQLSAQDIASSWVNTWEYSLFRGASETTPAVLQGMLDKLEESCKERGNWDVGDEASKKVKQVGRFLSGVANQIVSNKTGIDVAAAADGISGGGDPAGISEIKADIAAIIQKLIDSPGNPYKKVVFFVDDLDRIPPNDAVEVLEALKNIFDIPNCVFVLAIDYDVVVKGLESKFGPKTEENEREFRSFFDKIIQVPFSMPVGTYSIENFLLDKFSQMGYDLSAEDAEDYGKVVRLTIGTNPRSLKRYLNSYSLINQVKQVEEEHGSAESSLMLFALLGIQISYPYIFRMLAKHSSYTSWDATFTSKEDIDFESMKEKLSAYGESEYLDEEWEQILWSLCQRDSYLKSKAFDALSLFNFLRDKFGDQLNDEMEGAMEFAAITSVDDDASGKQAAMKVGHKTVFAGLVPKLAQMKESGLNDDGVESFNALMGYPSERAQTDEKYRMSFAKTGSAFYNDNAATMGEKQLLYVINPGKRKAGVKFYLKGNSGIKDEIQSQLLELIGVANISDTDLFSEAELDSKRPALLLEADLFEKLGKDRYFELLNHISKRICEVHDEL